MSCIVDICHQYHLRKLQLCALCVVISYNGSYYLPKFKLSSMSDVAIACESFPISLTFLHSALAAFRKIFRR